MNRILISLATAMLFAGMATTVQAQSYSLGVGSGAQVAIGNGLPLPIQVFLDVPTADTGAPSPGATSTELGGTPFVAGTYPPLLIPPVSNLAVGQGVGGTLNVPRGIMSLQPVSVQNQPTFASNAAVYQVNTAFDYLWPREQMATFSPGGGPAANGVAGVFNDSTGNPAGGSITYSNTGNQFGGSGRFQLTSGAPAAGGGFPGSPVTVYLNAPFGVPPGTMSSAAIVGAEAGSPVWGDTVNGTTVTTMSPPVPTRPFMIGSIGAGGTIITSMQCGTPGGQPVCGGAITNNVLGDKGFPFSTGFITVVQTAAAPAETFYLSGTDTRPGGVGAGNVSMVTGTLSNRTLTGPNANRGWVTMILPEPGTLLGAAGALAMLGACHTVIRRRERR